MIDMVMEYMGNGFADFFHACFYTKETISRKSSALFKPSLSKIKTL